MKKRWWILILILALILLVVAFFVIKEINTAECDAFAAVGSENACTLPAPYDVPASTIRLGIFGKYFGVV